ncbi:LysM peptidoglycan-binding domain-containing protein [Clostridium rectalis]|uniref:LysM peptidoglycan-binding domain-containing protein n=1 Tax=Clostridium rectalis TaxID=2040295 RepID=UPI000F62EBE2|nr:LysM domain-containing protein [Clostridium rectalis]
MEFWLKQDSINFQLPVPPESFEVSTGNLNTTVVVESMGEINILGKQKLDSISLRSFFPNQDYDFCQHHNFPKPYECIKIVKEIMKKGQIRLIITDTEINNLFYIENFTYGEKDGTGDVYYTIEFREFKKINSTVQAVNGSCKGAKRSGTKSVPKVYIVKSGDSLRKIAKWWYGDGNKADYLAKKNGIKNPKAIKIGTMLYL